MELPATGFVRLRQIIGDRKANPPIVGVFPVSRTTWYEGIKDGRYPAPVRIASKTAAWRVEDIRKLIAETA